MTVRDCLLLLSLILLILQPSGAIAGDIKQFRSFPVSTYDERGNYSDFQLTREMIPNPDVVSLDGWWPDLKMLLITLDVPLSAGSQHARESFFILYSAVDMKNAAFWDSRMEAKGGIQCNYGRVAGGSSQSKSAGTKRFASPC